MSTPLPCFTYKNDGTNKCAICDAEWIEHRGVVGTCPLRESRFVASDPPELEHYFSNATVACPVCKNFSLVQDPADPNQFDCRTPGCNNTFSRPEAETQAEKDAGEYAEAIMEARKESKSLVNEIIGACPSCSYGILSDDHHCERCGWTPQPSKPVELDDDKDLRDKFAIAFIASGKVQYAESSDEETAAAAYRLAQACVNESKKYK